MEKELKSWRSGGTPTFPGWVLGERVKSISEVNVGDILLDESVQFNALNLCRIESFPEQPEASKGSRCYALFVDPEDITKPRAPGDHEFCIWDFEFTSDTQSKFYRVSRAVS